MFNCDLRALRSISIYTTSRVRWGDHVGRTAPADHFTERETKFNLGEVPGGRIEPGMRFRDDALPFSAPVVGSNQHNDLGTVYMDVDATNQVETRGENSHQNQSEERNATEHPWETVRDRPQVSIRTSGVHFPMGQFGEGTSAMGERMGSRHQEGAAVMRETLKQEDSRSRAPQMPTEITDMNPYFGLDRDAYSYTHDYDLSIQESIADRVDEDSMRTRTMDDQRGF